MAYKTDKNAAEIMFDLSEKANRESRLIPLSKMCMTQNIADVVYASLKTERKQPEENEVNAPNSIGNSRIVWLETEEKLDKLIEIFVSDRFSYFCESEAEIKKHFFVYQGNHSKQESVKLLPLKWLKEKNLLVNLILFLCGNELVEPSSLDTDVAAYYPILKHFKVKNKDAVYQRKDVSTVIKNAQKCETKIDQRLLDEIKKNIAPNFGIKTLDLR